MSFDNDQNDFPLPAGKSADRKASNFLPRYFRTPTNKKFLQSTIDQQINEGVVEKLNSFVGRRSAKARIPDDTYLGDVSADRENYQFEPAVVYKDELNNLEFYADYNDYIGQLSNFGSTTSNHSLLNQQQSYSWNPHIDWDKFVNFREYYWLPLGPEPMPVVGQSKDVRSTLEISTATDDDNTAYVFTPDGFTRNPTLKLFKGQTYRITINCPGYPIALASSRDYKDNDPLLDVDAENVSTLYTDGVTKYVLDDNQQLIVTTDDYIEEGFIDFTPGENAPEELFYISQNDIDMGGLITIYGIEENTEIDVAAEIIGKQSYTTSTGVNLSNGMKIFFQGDVSPAMYSEGYFYVEGVGTGIQLVSDSNLEVPLTFVSQESVPFDGGEYPFDRYPFEDAATYPATKDYLVINRASADRNPWSRYNRWVHRDVIETSAKAIGLEPSFDQTQRAKRPIIEFEAGMKLYQHGNIAKANVNLVDTTTKDAFSNIEGQEGYIIDGVELTDGMRIVFTADTDIRVNGKIYQVKFINFGTGATKTRQISLVETDDTEPSDGECVLALQGNKNGGNMFYYENSKWNLSQQKTKVNQAPHFDLFDKNKTSLSDPITYKANTFTGTKFFTYAQGTGTNDSELGFPLKYRTITNVGDIVFDFNYSSDSFTYQDDQEVEFTKKTDNSFIQKYDSLSKEITYENAWKKSYTKSRQGVVRIYDNVTNNLDIDVFNFSKDLDIFAQVFVNGIKKLPDVDFTLQNGPRYKQIRFVKNLKKTDSVVVKAYANADKNANGFYEIPLNLECNPGNDNVTALTLGEVNSHVESIVSNALYFEGNFPGRSNLRDLRLQTELGTRFVQHEGPLNLALYHITNKDSNVVKAIEYAMDEYSKFKQEFMQAAETLGFDGSTKKHVDAIMKKITKDKTSNFCFFTSDMVPFNAALSTTHTIEYDGEAYFALETAFDLNTLSNRAVLVYANDELLIHGKDYEFENGFVKVTKSLVEDDEVVIIEYDNTNGSYVPPTPSKLGLLPSTRPEKFTDGANNFIRGHDGSYTLAYNDFRDDLLLELEKRIYNNTKLFYNKDILDINDFVGGRSRKNNFTAKEINRVLLKDFSNWLNKAGDPNYTENSFYSVSNEFTYNYSSNNDEEGNSLNGYWKGIYTYFFDTIRPHLRPWEMLGFTDEPTWWQSVYGPAPYTSSNTPLWQDLRDGAIKEPNKPVVYNKKFARKWLMSQIPANEFGELNNPIEAGIATAILRDDTQSSFKFGDFAPVENAWRNSAEYRFALLKSWVLLEPAKVLGLGFDISRIEKDIAGNIVYAPTQKRITTADLLFPTLTDTETTQSYTSGLVNYIANYTKYNKRNSVEKYKTQLTGIDNQLAFRLAGFADKNKLKLVLDSRSPLNKTSVFVPEENFEIYLNTSSVQETAVLSGFIIEKLSNGRFNIRGYDKSAPVFKTNPVKIRTADPAITVGGVSENFVEWNENKTYTVGTIVNLDGTYYRTKITHTSGTDFDVSKFAKLAELPIEGGVSAVLRQTFEDTIVDVDYGTEFANVQEVADFMLGYENYLKNTGFIFESVNAASAQTEDMKLVLQEFMFWVTQGWDTGTVLAVSPIANEVKFTRQYFSVDNIYDSFYDDTIISGPGEAVEANFTNIYRDRDVDFTLKPVDTDDGIFLIKLPLVQTEHVVLLDNTTVFNDTIYDKVPGFRQERIKLNGYRTDGWTGNLNVPGFIYDQAKITLWTANTDYGIGDLIKYKEFYYSAFNSHTSGETFVETNWRRLPEKPVSQIYPNWDYKSNQFADFYDLDTDNFDTEQQRLAQHLIGYQPREYLSNIITDSVSQYKFYQGFIQDKGTKNALSKLFDPLSAADKDSVEFYEEWAFRLGQYGAIDNLFEIEYQLDESKYRTEPQIFELTQGINPTRLDLTVEIPQSKVYKKPSTYDHTIVPTKNTTGTYTRDSGYVKNDQVSFVISEWDFVADISPFDLSIGENIWVTKDNNDKWNAYKHVNSGLVVESYDADTFGDEDVLTITTTNYIKDIAVDDFVGIITDDPLYSGFGQVVNVELDKLTVSGVPVQPEEERDSSIVGTSITKFVSRRFDDATDVNSNLTDMQKDTVDTIWVDNNGTGNWTVYENRYVFDLSREVINQQDTTEWGKTFDLNRTNLVMAVGDPSNEQVSVYTRTSRNFDWNTVVFFGPNNSYDSVPSEYGHSVAVSPDGNTIAVGVPLASNALTRFKGPLRPGVPYTAGDIVSDRGSLFRARNNIDDGWFNVGDSSDSSTIFDSSAPDGVPEDWERVYRIEAGEGSTDSSGSEQGVVYVYTRDKTTQVYELDFVMTSPEPRAFAQFGHKVVLSEDSTGATRMFVSAPGDDAGRIYFFENVPGPDSEWKWTRNDDYKGIYSDSELYNLGDIVFYDGQLYKALTNLQRGTALPTDTSKWEVSEQVEHTGFIPNKLQDLDNENIGNEVTRFGQDFAVNAFGDKLVAMYLDANIDEDSSKSKVLAIYNQPNKRWTHIQRITPITDETGFAFSFDIDDAGDNVAVSQPFADEKGIDSGTVYVYTQGSNDTYTQTQKLNSPFNESNEVFGTSVAFGGNKLVIVGKNSDTINYTTFDLIDEDNVTTFDNSNTKFSQTVEDSGRLIIFEELDNNYIFAEDVDYRRDLNGFSMDNIKVNFNQIYLSLPNYAPTSARKPLDDDKYQISNNRGIIAEISTGKTADAWTAIAQQNDKPDIEKINQVFLYNVDTQDIVQKLDVVDPRQGKIVGIAEQNISYKTPYDPADYNENTNWGPKEVGTIWWNIDTASWYDVYQGDNNYRTSKFNTLIPGSTVQICEWVGTDLLPDEWLAQSGTAEGYAAGITGVPLFGSLFTTERVYDSVSQTFKPQYFYWVQNTEIVPNVEGRTISAQNIATLIADPASLGYRYAVLLSNKSFALYNCKSLVEGTNTVIQFRIQKDSDLQTNIHSEYQLISQGLDLSMPQRDIETKWHDSLIGYDALANVVPDVTLPESQKYGLLNVPRQSMFVNRLEAVKQFIERANSVFAKYQIVDNYNISKLQLAEPFPNIKVGNYDVAVDTEVDLQYIGVAKTQTAEISLTIDSGTITEVQIVNPGNGYKYAPRIEIEDAFGYGAILNTTINNTGKIVSVDIRKGGKNYSQNAIPKIRKFSALVKSDSTLGGIWTIYEWNKSTQNWDKVTNQSYDTNKYWNYIDWYAPGYSDGTVIDHVIEQSYLLFGLEDNIGDIVKIKSVGSGGWLLLKKKDNKDTEDYTVNYDTVGRENGTIELKDLLYNYSVETTGYDANVYDISFYDKEPVQELRNIISAIKEDLFVGDLVKEYNELFFAGIRYAHSEQVNVDWAFKTSFVRAKHNVGGLTQKITFQNDNLENYQDYIEEVKPYKTKIREYISAYTRIEPTQSMVTDFDLPPSYVGGSIKPSNAIYSNDTITQLFDDYNQYPYKNWVDNNKYEVVKIAVADGGAGYENTPIVKIAGDNPPTARAYLARGKVKTIEIDTKGQRYFKAPVVTIEGQATKPARAVAILGEPNVRSTHMVVRFDRVSGKKYIEDINAIETFTGTGAKEKFVLKWPMDLNTTKYTIEVDGVQALSSEYTVGNDVDFSLGHERFLGYVKFNDVPKTGTTIKVSYKKDTRILQAADRIFTKYEPTEGMPGIGENESLASLMRGVEYEGVLYDAFPFGNDQGFGAGGFGDVPYDTFTNTYDDEVIVLDGSTNIIQLAEPLEDGVTYNVYYNGKRIDDPAYDGSTELTNTNAVMLPVSGDGSTDSIDISALNDDNTLVDGDIIIVRKQTSDGSFTPVGTTYDTALSGGSIDYSTASGQAAGEVIVDGDGFYTEKTSGGPEELVPGTVVDTLDMKVYHRATDGVGIIGVANYFTDGENFRYRLPEQPAGVDSIIVAYEGEVLDSTLYSVDYENNTIDFDDSTSTVGANLCIITVGANGADLIDTNIITYEGEDTIVTLADYKDAQTVILFENGVALEKDTDFEIFDTGDGDDSTPTLTYNKAAIRLLKTISTGSKLQYVVYDNALQSYSQITINEFNNDSTEGNYYKFTDQTPVPFNRLPISHNILVKTGSEILSPGYSIRYTLTDERNYDLDLWQFREPLKLDSSDVLVFIDDKLISRDYWAFDNINAKIRLLRSDIGLAGSKLDVYIITNADYYFIDTKITLGGEDSTSSVPDLTDIVEVGDTVTLTSVLSSTKYELVVEKVGQQTLTVQSQQKELLDEFVADPEFVVSVNEQDSTYYNIQKVEYILSNNLTIASYNDVLPIQVYQFSNHDINNFQRYTYDVLTSTYVDTTSSSYVRRNLLSNGTIQLEKPVENVNYVWVMKNNKLLSPGVDYVVTSNLNAVQLTKIPAEKDRIDVLHFAKNKITPVFGYRIFKDMLNRTVYKRLNQENSYVLAEDLNYYDYTIKLEDATGVQIPDKTNNLPGILFIDGERIEYFEISGNNLKQVRRGTLGTGVKTVHAAGSRAYGAGPGENINYADTLYTHTTRADGSTDIVDMEFTVSNVNEIEVFVGGRRLRKNAISVFNPALDQDSPAGDETSAAEYTVTNGVITLATEPADGVEIKVVKRQGQTWTEPGTSLADSKLSVGRFLRDATIELPR